MRSDWYPDQEMGFWEFNWWHIKMMAVALAIGLPICGLFGYAIDATRPATAANPKRLRPDDRLDDHESRIAALEAEVAALKGAGL